MTIEVETKRIRCFFCGKIITITRESKMQFVGDCPECEGHTIYLTGGEDNGEG